MPYRCKSCGRKIKRKELEGKLAIKCPKCGSYKLKLIEKSED